MTVKHIHNSTAAVRRGLLFAWHSCRVIAEHQTAAFGPTDCCLLCAAAPPAVDVTEEADQLSAAAEALAVSQARVCQEVARHNGDVSAALAALGRPPSSASSSGTIGGVRQRHQRTFSPLQASPQKVTSHPYRRFRNCNSAGSLWHPI